MSFKKYISRKEVQAEPMDEARAVEMGLARPNTDDHEWRQGYHIIYPDGYQSWCPKRQFEEANRQAETVLDRLYIERHELQEKIIKLKNFLFTQPFNELEETQQDLLVTQLGAMTAYKNILEKRIAAMEVF